MKNLKAFVEMENRVAYMFGGTVIDLDNLTQDVVERMFQRLDSNLSPEVLACDGERPISKQRKYYKLYTGAILELKKMGYFPTETMYNV